MIRVLLFLVLLAAVAGGAAWFADHPGWVTITWQGYRIDTSVGFLAFAVALLVVVGALVDRAWRMLRRAPGALSCRGPGSPPGLARRWRRSANSRCARAGARRGWTGPDW